LRRLAQPLGLFGLALILFSFNNNFTLGLHPDEVGWANDVLTAHWDLAQPLLLREVVMLVVARLHVGDSQQAVDVGRWVCAAAVAGGIVGLFWIVRRRAGAAAALIAAAAASLTPLVAIHAHYFKDDAPLFCCCTLAVLAFRRFLAEPRWPSVALLGLALGAAVSSKEPGLFLFPVLGLTILTQPRCEWRASLVGLLAASAIAIIVIVLANVPMLLESARTASELSAQNRGIFTGHWDGVHYAPGFHFTHSLLQGVGPGFMAVAAIGLMFTMRRRFADPIDRLMAIYVVVYYAAIELSPMKPGPDAGRYALPLVVPLAYFFGLAIGEGRALLVAALPRWRRGVSMAFYAGAAGVAAIAGVSTLRLVADLADDTRHEADRVLSGKEPQIVTELFGTSIGRHVPSLATLDLGQLEPETRYLVASSLLYGRYQYGAAVGGPLNAAAAATWAKYQAIFAAHRYCEIRPPFMTYAMSNPTIRIVDLTAPPANGDRAPACGGG
jgi:4-amino-4-deoxy-L-arabinose transferase-like glycosyltransferase